MDNQIVANLLFNIYDFYLIVMDMYLSLYYDDFNRIGEDMGRMISDIFLKNPSSYDWSFTNSLVYKNELNDENGLLVQVNPLESANSAKNLQQRKRPGRNQKKSLLE
mmetsp:Transcript_18279/g.17404  ORF Transcript_18279/g.17404 Transcript_18279/m.17404 type:complete len:107 (-) Transcript_18279:209-529(-)|eukprot:CAMPEP_0170542398 /NCGR_PEP_ID=MMETSP0211-20121228/1834_1 /TAXON_ID=311385 /ORGANISM="Pseudokeronopsis sp., Strain OXSARD2" /LENGTH=106 /DNA_ID=CAMNT_0010845441 /DNA_START=378 /DNA_END=698 /DNA_ORIENTATION=+